MTHHDTSLIGIGLYTPAEASRLIKVPAGTLARWLKGHGTGNRRYDALWRGQIERTDQAVHLSFLDLVQARVAAAFVQAGLSPQKVRRAILLASALIGASHPFATARFKTDGRTLLLEGLNEDPEDRPLVDLFRQGRSVMGKVVAPSLRNIEFDDETASRWWPAGRSGGVVLDPKRQFGRPIVADVGVPTEVLSRAVEAEGSIALAARMFGVPLRKVEQAMSFEQSLAT